jgi:hypothetical protein
VEDIFQATVLSQTAQGLKTGLYGQAFIDNKPYSFGIASGPQSLAKLPDFPGFKQKIRSRQCRLVHGSFLRCVTFDVIIHNGNPPRKAKRR